MYSFPIKSNSSTVNPKNTVLTKYYRTVNLDGSPNSTTTTYVTNPSLPTVYRGIKNQFMCKEDYRSLTTDILTFEGHRTPGNDNIPSLYKETLTINSRPYVNNYICASATYIDPGNGFETTLSSMDYTVLGSSGIYKGFKTIRIYFNNKNHTRIVRIF